MWRKMKEKKLVVSLYFALADHRWRSSWQLNAHFATRNQIEVLIINMGYFQPSNMQGFAVASVI